MISEAQIAPSPDGIRAEMPSAAARTEAAARFLSSPWVVVAVLAFAALLRFWDVTQWSLWEDEETTVFFSQNLQKPFPSFFPIYFALLSWVYEITAVSVASGRVFAALLGILNIGLVYACFRRLLNRPTAMLAAVFLTVNLGHLFWSQSIRYFMLTLTFQLLCAYWFFTGFERKSYARLVLSNVALTFALLTHFSAVLLVPVLIAYLGLMVMRRESSGAYGLKGYIVFCVPFLAILGAFAKRFLQMKGLLDDMPSPLARDPVHVVVTALAYFGVPVIGLGLLYPLLGRRTLTRVGWFICLLGIIPALELIVIARLNLANVTWYYGLVSLVGFAGLAAMSLVYLYEHGRRKLSVSLGAAACAYYLVFLGGYYTTMHGDRPRWKDAAAYLVDREGIRAEATANPDVYASVCGTVAFYLGVPPAQTMGHPLVKHWPQTPPMPLPSVEQWYVVEAGVVGPDYERWFADYCVLKARFDARSGPKDRSVLVYHYLPKQGS
ncbi:MAG TPA: glycosyltransferase family 39 protein [Gemmataceae bacterium]|jgi:hypothetical protein|nr:glycosyltransferase family 39 protein [Gemmataceae bacterium]